MHGHLASARARSAAPPAAFFDRWADVDTWPEWDSAVAWCRRDGAFVAGTTGMLKPVRGPKVRFTIETMEPDREFTDVSSLPGARLRIRHLVSVAADGRSEVEVTVSVEGPLARLWGRCSAGRSPTRRCPAWTAWWRWSRPTGGRSDECLARGGLEGPRAQGGRPGHRPDRPREEGRPGRMRRGDDLVYYSPRESLDSRLPVQAFTAIGTVVDDEVWQADEGEFRPWRRRVAYVPGARDVPVGALRAELDLTRAPNWGYQLRRGLVPLSDRDVEVIGAAMGGRG